MPEAGSGELEAGSLKPEDGSQKSGVRSQKSEEIFPNWRESSQRQSQCQCCKSEVGSGKLEVGSLANPEDPDYRGSGNSFQITKPEKTHASE